MQELPWIVKYRPRTTSDFIGNEDVVTLCKNFIESWLANRPMKKLIILYGRNGTGKTTLPMTLAKDYGMHMIRFNASENRTHKSLKLFKSECIVSALNGRKKVLILDEADYLHSSAKTSGLKWMITNTRNPIFVTVNDLRAIPYDGIRKDGNVMTLHITHPTPKQILELLNRIAKAEEIELDMNLVQDIIHNVRSFRGAIQAFERGWLEESDTFEDNDEYELTRRLLAGENINMNISPDNLLVWIHDNTYKNRWLLLQADNALAYTKQAKDYRFWKYAYYFLGQCRDSQYKKGRSVKFPSTFTLSKKKAKPSDKNKTYTSTMKRIGKRIPSDTAVKAPTKWNDYF